jgi:hypothetical protein
MSMNLMEHKKNSRYGEACWEVSQGFVAPYLNSVAVSLSTDLAGQRLVLNTFTTRFSEPSPNAPGTIL